MVGAMQLWFVSAERNKTILETLEFITRKNAV